MPVCTKTIIERGGRELIELLTHCVFSFNTDVLFLYCVGEYQLRPQAVSALAIYDVFCAPAAPARISDPSQIPPKDMRVGQTIADLRQAFQAATCDPPQPKAVEDDDDDDERRDAGQDDTPAGSTPPVRPAVPLPPRYLFDSIAANLAVSEQAKIATLENYYDPKRTPQENLPGGELTDVQRAFVDHVWTPRIRPYLVSSGFWRVSTVG
ncbi:hypothetical protein Enr13x_19860 [Stieleria neptunia]|uniref:Uncharacterized protein n=1 Tax=Stieleria neptunia TaxID=2527979 RepID=A0A518HMR5_9BACT|nr:hypothetical protein [Stieleria neptunia]QDV42143.1 hypothetical protein Enr13x_19860 [Stieleria neptunia]